MASNEERLIAYRRTVAIIIALVVFVLAFLIIRPFLIPIIAAAVLTYIFYPLYKFLADRLPKFLPRNSIAALITCLLVVAIVLIPMVSITGLLTKEIRNGYVYFQQVVHSPNFSFNLPPMLSERLGDISQYEEQIANFGIQVIGWMQGVIKAIPNVALGIFITIFALYYFLKGREAIFEFLQDFFPLPTGRYKQIVSRFDDLSRGILLGQIVVGTIHGLLAWGAYSFLAVPNPVLWAFITAIISIIPVLGAALVWFPIAVYLYVTGLVNGTYWQGIALLIYGLLVMTTIDNALKPKIMGDSAHIHPLVLFLGILGGIQLLGLPGIVIGPLVLALFDVVMEILREVV